MNLFRIVWNVKSERFKAYLYPTPDSISAVKTRKLLQDLQLNINLLLRAKRNVLLRIRFAMKIEEFAQAT